MNEIILLKLGELVLKGGNRHSFEEKLMSNAKRRLKSFGKFKVASPPHILNPRRTPAIWTGPTRP